MRAWASFFSSLVAAAPVRRQSDGQAVSPIETGHDAWAEALSGVGPLIILIGEKNTKQLLREAHGAPGILSMSFAPIGLLSVLTSMIRICGSQKLRSYLGYEHEPRTNAALEVTRANCEGIHAEVVAGFIARSTAPDSPSRALAVAILKGHSAATIRESIKQIQSCYKFLDAKTAKGCPKNVGNVNWCFKIVHSVEDPANFRDIAPIVALALNLGPTHDFGNIFCVSEPPAQELNDKKPFQAVLLGNRAIPGAGSKPTTTTTDLRVHMVAEQEGASPIPIQASSTQTSSLSEAPKPRQPLTNSEQLLNSPSKEKDPPVQIFKPAFANVPELSCVPPTKSESSNGNDVAPISTISLPEPIKSSFFCTFDGVSELSATEPTPTSLSIIVAVTSFLSMIAAQVLCLWQEDWSFPGIIMVFVGYFSMVFGVFSAGCLIYSSCDSATMSTQPRTSEADWVHGLVLVVKNTDSLDTTGSRLMQGQGRKHVFEAVWLKKPGSWRLILAWIVTLFLILAFVCYYLGCQST